MLNPMSLFLLITLAILGVVALCDEPSQSYETAYGQSQLDNKPLLVVVGAQWCEACHELESTTIREMSESGQLAAVNMATVDYDADPALTKRLVRDNRLPQLIIFSQSRSSGRWIRSQLIGMQEQEPIRKLIRNAVASIKQQ